MTDREKLYKLLDEAINDEDTSYYNIVDYLLENGVIVPPCKVGQILYLLYPVRKGVYEAVVDEISISNKSNFIVLRDLYFNRRTSVFFEQVGKTVFFTKEEAEKALQELNNTN